MVRPFIVLGGLLLSVAVGAQAKVEKPAAGSKLRKAVLDALRPSIEKDLKQKVIFKVETIRVYDGWAFVKAQPLTPKSKPIDFKKTHHKQRIEDGVFDGDVIYALLKLKSKVWKVADFVIGPTDVYWSNWTGPPYSAPKEVLPPPFGPG